MTVSVARSLCVICILLFFSACNVDDPILYEGGDDVGTSEDDAGDVSEEDADVSEGDADVSEDDADAASCTPDCEGRECGDDGCGGSCGDCLDSQQCGEAGICECKDGEIDEAGICDIWVLEADADQWSGFGLSAQEAEHAPGSPIRAAFDIEDDDLAFVLTDDTYHSFQPSTGDWLDSWPLTELEPGLMSVDVVFAYSIPSSHGENLDREGINFSGMDGDDKIVWQKYFERSTQTFSVNPDGLDGEVHEWTKANAADPAALRASWLDIENSRGWIDADPSEFCDTQMEETGPYIGHISDDHIYIVEAGACFEWLEPRPVGDFEAFQLPGAPSAHEIGAAFWHQGHLYIFRGE